MDFHWYQRESEIEVCFSKIFTLQYKILHHAVKFEAGEENRIVCTVVVFFMALLIETVFIDRPCTYRATREFSWKRVLTLKMALSLQSINRALIVIMLNC